MLNVALTSSKQGIIQMLSVLIAVDDHGAIGLDGKLPWKDPKDMAWFQSVTFGKTLIVGRKTAESLPKLHGRNLIIMSRQCDQDGNNLGSAICGTQWQGFSDMDQEFIVIGGAEIYKSAYPYADFYYLRRIRGKHKADTYCPFPLPWNVSRPEGI